MCQINKAEYRVNCINKSFVNKRDIMKCFGIGNEKATELFEKVKEDTIKAGKLQVDDTKVYFPRLLKLIGMNEKQIFDDYDRLLSAKENEARSRCLIN